MQHYKITTLVGIALLLVSPLAYALDSTFASWLTGLLGGLFLLIGLAETWLDPE